VHFYRDVVGLPLVGRFSDHAGYDGAMFGLPGRDVHLEVTQRQGDDFLPRPTAEDLLVLYLPDADACRCWCERLRRHGHSPVAPENPYWADKATMFEDPDGWRIVFCNTAGLKSLPS